LLVCKYVLYYCHRVATQLQLTNISYHISHHIISYIYARESCGRGVKLTTHPSSSETEMHAWSLNSTAHMLLQKAHLIKHSGHIPSDLTAFQ